MTFGVGEREKVRSFERRRLEGFMSRFAEILLEIIVKMCFFTEVRRITVMTFDH